MKPQSVSTYRVSLLSAAIAASLLIPTGAAMAQQQEPEVEEVVVTGSFIRRSEGFQAASPILQFDAEDIANEGTPNMGDVIRRYQ
jgi:hypothetical protein